jgi:DNA-directed RNA polymerase specialized sigma24 family protein
LDNEQGAAAGLVDEALLRSMRNPSIRDEYESAWYSVMKGIDPHLRMLLTPLVPEGHIDDVLGEVWVIAVERVHKFELRDPDSFRAWLYQIGRNAAFRLKRQHARNMKNEISAANEEPWEARRFRFEEALGDVGVDAGELMDRAIQALKKSDRALVRLLLEDRSVKHIQHHFRLKSPAAARKRIQRARDTLRAYMIHLRVDEER